MRTLFANRHTKFQSEFAFCSARFYVQSSSPKFRTHLVSSGNRFTTVCSIVINFGRALGQCGAARYFAIHKSGSNTSRNVLENLVDAAENGWYPKN
jgi:hypothetical protein